VAVAFVLFTQLDVHSSPAMLIVGFAIMGLCEGPLLTLGTNLVVGSAPPEQAGSSSSMTQVANEAGASLGVAVMGSIGAAVYVSQLNDTAPAGVDSSTLDTARENVASALTVAPSLPGEVGQGLTDAAKRAHRVRHHLRRDPGRRRDPDRGAAPARATDRAGNTLTGNQRKGNNAESRFVHAAAEDTSDTELARHARWFRDVQKYVVSSRLTEAHPAWPHTTILRDVHDIKDVQQQPGKNLVIFGGIDVTNSFAMAGLIDDYYIHLNPSTIPEGRLLLDGHHDLHLADVRAHRSGVLVLHYARSVTLAPSDPIELVT
jgi:hypothetical protein